MDEKKLQHLAILQQQVTDTHIYFQQLQACTHQRFLQLLASQVMTTDVAQPLMATVSDSPNIPNIHRAVLTAQFTPALGQPLAVLSRVRRIAIVNDQLGIAAKLALLFKQAGYAADVDASHLTDISSDTDALIDLCGLQSVANVDEAIELNYRAFTTLQLAIKPLAAAEGCYVSVQDTGGDFALGGLCSGVTSLSHEDNYRVWAGGISALTKTLHAEYPSLTVKALDVATRDLSNQQIAHKIFTELTAGSPHIEVGLRANGERITLATLPQAVAPSRLTINKDAAILVSGGARGVTADCVIELAKSLPAHFVLLGRTALQPEAPCYASAVTFKELQVIVLQQAKQAGQTQTPRQIKAQVDALLALREIKSTLQAIQATGATAEYVALDIQNSDAVAAVAAAVREQHNIIGFIHGAGVLADRLLHKKTLEQFSLVFNTKIKGLQALLAATATDNLQLMCFFSSVAARYGNRGQCDYAMANEVLNKVAQLSARRDANCRVKSINWGPWEGGMVTAELKQAFAVRGITLLPNATGTQLFTAELSDTTAGATEVVIGSGLNPDDKLSALTQYNYWVNVGHNQQPFLLDHQINAQVVIPACLVLEWFVQAAQALDTDWYYYTCTNITVLRGIQLPDFEHSSQSLRIEVAPQQQNQQLILSMLLFDADDKLRYSGTIIKTPQPITAQQNVVTAIEAPSAWPWHRACAYQPEKLFHGPHFQVITDLLTIGSNGATALLAVKPTTHACTPFITLDGCLQLMRLWSLHHYGKLSLPTKIGGYQAYTFEWPDQVHCILNSEAKDAYHSVHRVQLQSQSGQILAVLTDVEAFYLQNN